MDIDISTAQKRVVYDPATGNFWWRVDNRGNRRAGDVAGTTNAQGYRFVKICQKKYPAHRLAFAMYYGRQPFGEIDHINGNPSDNRICNLREVTRQQNCQNNKSAGVRYEADRGKWLARIHTAGTTINLGRFDTEEEALRVRRAAASAYFGGYARAK